MMLDAISDTIHQLGGSSMRFDDNLITIHQNPARETGHAYLGGIPGEPENGQFRILHYKIMRSEIKNGTDWVNLESSRTMNDVRVALKTFGILARLFQENREWDVWQEYTGEYPYLVGELKEFDEESLGLGNIRLDEISGIPGAKEIA